MMFWRESGERWDVLRLVAGPCAVFVAALFLGAPWATAADAPATDAAFLEKAAQANAAEVKISQAAQTRALRPAIKSFADRMVEDHSALNREIEAMAKKKGVAVTTEPDAAHLMKFGSLQKLEGGAFDRAYVDLMIEDHTAAVHLFEQAASDSADADEKKFAETTLPMLREHLEAAKALPL